MVSLYRSVEGEARLRAAYRGLLAQWPVPRVEVEVSTAYGPTFVIVGGREDAPPLVLLHGSGGNSAMWLRDVAQWAPHFRIHAVDVIGDPGLSAQTRPRIDSGVYASWLTEVLAALGLGQVALAGMSLGGWLALDWATRFPERVSRLVLLSPAGIGRQRATFLLRVLPLLLLGGWGRRQALAMTSGRNAQGDAHAPYMDFLAQVQRDFRRRMDPLPVFPDESLRRLTMPVLTIVGDRDVILDSAETCRRLGRLVPGAECGVIAGAGHALHGQANRILAFLQGAPRPQCPGAEALKSGNSTSSSSTI